MKQVEVMEIVLLYGLRGWWRPEETGTATPSISVGYDTTDYDGCCQASNKNNYVILLV